MRHSLKIAAVCAAVLAAQPGSANDSVAGFGVGGLELRQTDAVRLVREHLQITKDEIRVDYVFRNETDAPVSGIVAFPLPPVGGEDWLEGYALPLSGRMDYVGFTTLVDGEPVTMTPEHRITLDGVDRTDELLAIGVQAVAVHNWEVLEMARRDWTPDQEAALAAQGFVDENGRPRWVLHSTYWREQRFAPHTDVRVSHRYHPVSGGSVDSWFPGPDPAIARAEPQTEAQAEARADYDAMRDTMRARYCVTPEDEARMRAQVNGETGLVGFSTFFSTEIDYILTTGANWRGPIGDFTLVVEAPGAHDFLFLCLPGARWVSQSRVEFSARDFVPTQDLSIYISRAVGEAIQALED
ncbi:MAG: DUF4424 family protein [Pararhodobacter sp.]|nr:DUF4424 family protein [Pararhodobacter sp.]